MPRDDETTHVRAFVQLDPRTAIVECVCGATLGPDDFMGLTSNHDMLEAAMRWFCKQCLYHPYAAVPVGPKAKYHPIFDAREVDNPAHWAHQGEEIAVLTPLPHRTRSGRRLYTARFANGDEATVTHLALTSEKQFRQSSGTEPRTLAMLTGGRS